jgi:three-Cys-motif partner protein
MSDNEDFFVERRALAVLKHGILRRYVPIFAAKVGVRGRRIVLLDGYAGRGEYKDRSPGSPLLLARSARRLANLRDITGVYVEQNRADYENLREVLAPYGPDTARVLHGDLHDRLPEILRFADGAALFAFLDPFGVALNRGQLTGGLLGRGGSAPSEVLLHVSVSTVARLGGLLRKRRRQGIIELDDPDAKAISHVDDFLGGTWWQADFEPVEEGDDERATEAALRVTERFRKSLCGEIHYHAVSMPVRRRPGHFPKYVLVLFTRHHDGLWKFADVLGAAGREWEGAWRADLASDQLRKERERARSTGQQFIEDVFTRAPFDPKKYEEEHREEWQRTIEANLRRLLAVHERFYLTDYLDGVYGELLGAAGERHVRAAVKALNKAGAIVNDGVGDNFFRNQIIRRPGPDTHSR